MKHQKQLLAVLLMGAACTLQAQRSETLLEKNWKFSKGDFKEASQPEFNDTKWESVVIPHDWAIFGPFDMNNDLQNVAVTQNFEKKASLKTGRTGGLPYVGTGWYRTSFDAPADKEVTLLFDGAMSEARVYVNGKEACFWPFGYNSFHCNVTSLLNKDGKNNTLAVRLENRPQSSRWYPGAGLYRNVHLIVTDKVHVPVWGTQITTPHVSKDFAAVRLQTKIDNADEKTQIRIETEILSPDGKVATSKENTSRINHGQPFEQNFIVNAPELWSPESPSLYKAVSKIYADDKLVDTYTTRFGIRNIEYIADKGFYLNGKHRKFQGVCNHHDLGPLGAAINVAALRHQLTLLKDMGCDAIRTSHNMPTPELVALCDEMGFMMMIEPFDEWDIAKCENGYHRYFNEWAERDMVNMLHNYRNNPCVIMWSIGNEVEQRADEPEGDLISKRLVNTVRKYDTSRFTTIGSNDFWDRRQFSWDKDSYRIFKNLDVAGYNYIWWKYESDHAAYPDRVIYGSESYPKEAAQNWNLVEKHPYVIGDFVWTAIDYLGEAGLAHALYLKEGEHDTQFMGWPWYNGWCGDIDLCGDKKPQSYYRDVLWRERPITMAVHAPVPEGKKEVVNGWGWPNELVSWNWTSCEGKVMKVNVYSRSPKVKLYLNDKLIGEKETGKENYTATFDVPYEPGTLKAVNSKGKEEFVLKTAGAPAAIRLIADRSKIKACKNDLSYVKIELVDKNGNVVPETSLPVKIECTGKGTVIAGGNAAYADMESFRSLTPNTFRGKAIAIVQPDGEKGDIQVKVSAKGLEDASIVITTY